MTIKSEDYDPEKVKILLALAKQGTKESPGTEAGQVIETEEETEEEIAALIEAAEAEFASEQAGMILKLKHLESEMDRLLPGLRQNFEARQNGHFKGLLLLKNRALRMSDEEFESTVLGQVKAINQLFTPVNPALASLYDAWRDLKLFESDKNSSQHQRLMTLLSPPADSAPAPGN